MSATLIVLTNYLPVPVGTHTFTLKDDETYFGLDGALSFGFTAQPISVGRTYRNELPASYIGRKWINIVLSTVEDLNVGNWASEGSSGTSSTPIAQLLDVISANDDRFNNTPPHDSPLQITFMCFMDGATGAGNCIAMFPASQFDQFSPGTPTRY